MTANGNICFRYSKVSNMGFLAYNFGESISGGVYMCRINLRKALGLSAVCFGTGVLAAFVLPGYLIAFACAAAVICAGLLLLGKHN